MTRVGSQRHSQKKNKFCQYFFVLTGRNRGFLVKVITFVNKFALFYSNRKTDDHFYESPFLVPI